MRLAKTFPFEVQYCLQPQIGVRGGTCILTPPRCVMAETIKIRVSLLCVIMFILSEHK